MYIHVVIDRFTMAPFVGVDLPTVKNKKIVIDENTTDEQIDQSVIDDEKHLKMFRDEYLPKARRRSTKIIIAAIAVYLFTILSWTILLIITSAIAVSIGIGILVLRIKRKTNKVDDETLQD